MSREYITDHTIIDRKANNSFYLKIGSEGNYIRRPKVEYEGYKMLSPFLRTPKVRLADTSSGPVLVIRGVDAPSASLSLLHNPERVAASLNMFLLDVVKMWQKTIKPMEVKSLSRNWKSETTNTLLRLVENPQIQAIGNLPVIVNGCTYPTLMSTITECLKRLSTTNESIMVLCHGDEHLGNLLSSPDGYWAIDPGNYTGYNTPSSAVNNLVGGTYLFDFRYAGEAVIKNGTFSVDYSLTNNYVHPEQLIRPIFKNLESFVIDMVGSNSLSKELLFTNELRVALGWTQRRMDLSDVRRTGLVYAGLASEHYYAKDII